VRGFHWLAALRPLETAETRANDAPGKRSRRMVIARASGLGIPALGANCSREFARQSSAFAGGDPTPQPRKRHHGDFHEFARQTNPVRPRRGPFTAVDYKVGRPSLLGTCCAAGKARPTRIKMDDVVTTWRWNARTEPTEKLIRNAPSTRSQGSRPLCMRAPCTV